MAINLKNAFNSTTTRTPVKENALQLQALACFTLGFLFTLVTFMPSLVMLSAQEPLVSALTAVFVLASACFAVNPINKRLGELPKELFALERKRLKLYPLCALAVSVVLALVHGAVNLPFLALVNAVLGVVFSVVPYNYIHKMDLSRRYSVAYNALLDRGWFTEQSRTQNANRIRNDQKIRDEVNQILGEADTPMDGPDKPKPKPKPEPKPVQQNPLERMRGMLKSKQSTRKQPEKTPTAGENKTTVKPKSPSEQKPPVQPGTPSTQKRAGTNVTSNIDEILKNAGMPKQEKPAAPEPQKPEDEDNTTTTTPSWRKVKR